MVTRRDDAKSELQIKQDVYAYVTGELRRGIESNIVRHGKIGFLMCAENIAYCATEYLGSQFQEVAIEAINDVVQEYVSAGWTVSCEINKCSSVPLGHKILLKFR